MKKFLNLFTSLGVTLSLLVGCSTISNLTPQQISTVSTVLTQTADEGAIYAIQQDKKNANYFQLADATIDTFVLGNDLSPSALQTALTKIPGATNQWTSLAVSGVVIAYDLSYQQYVSGQVSNSPAAVAWINAVETGFKQALAQTGSGLHASKPITPYFLKNGAVSKAAIKAKLK